MSKLKTVIGINLLLLLTYTIIVNLISTGNERALAVMILLAILIVGQVGVNIVASIIHFANQKPDAGREFLLSAGIVLLVGFSACWGTASI